MTSNLEAHAVQLFGRDRHLAACERLLVRADREGGVLLLRGPAGIGKTALLDAARARAQTLGLRVLSTSGLEAESAFAFAALQPLLLPVIGAADSGLPPHLRASLLSALGLLDAEIPAAQTVGLAALGLLSAAAREDRPLCLLIDDVHWLDASSADVLRFLSRRLSADPVVVLATGRDGAWPPPETLPETRVEPLGEDDARRLLTSQFPELSAAAARRVLAVAEGNPLGIVELSAALSAERAAGPVLPLTARLEAAFAGRADSLTEEARTVLLAAALAPTATLPEILAAASMLTGAAIPPSTLDAVLDGRLATAAGRQIRFRHPLVRSSLIHQAQPSRLQAAHHALAEVIRDPQRSLQHRAEAAVGEDEELALSLEAAAVHATRRGSPASAIAALEQAAALTLPGPARGRRLVRAADLTYRLGQTDRSVHLLAQAGAAELARADRATARRLELAIAGRDTGDPAPIRELIALAEQALDAHDDDGALELLAFAASLTVWGERWHGVGPAIAATARRIPVADTDPRIIGIIAHATPIVAHRDLAARLEKLDETLLTDPVAQQTVGFAAVVAGDYELGARLLARADQQFRDQAQLALLAPVLTFRGIAAFSSGRWRMAEQVLDEAERLIGDTLEESWLARTRYVRAGVAGLCGDEERHREIIDELVARYEITNSTHRDNHLTFMRGITATMLGHHDEALNLLGALYETDDPTYDPRTGSDALFYLADSAAAKHRPDLVHRAIDVIDTTVPPPLPASFRSAVDYALAVTAPPAQAEALFDAALAGSARDRPYDLARVQLAYGHWLRHQLQPMRARGFLRQSLATFDRLGNEPYTARAHRELRAAGERTPQPSRADWSRLSPQEYQIAQLVAEGLSNKRIGERLFLSPRTIASHLYRIFPKLGITSRTQLAALMLTQEATDGAAPGSKADGPAPQHR